MATKQGPTSSFFSYYQSFTPSETFALYGIEININSIISGTAKANFYIYDADEDGKPTGAGTLIGSLSTTETGWQGDFTLSANPNLVVGNRYCIRLKGSVASGEYYFTVGAENGNEKCWYWNGSDYVDQECGMYYKLYAVSEELKESYGVPPEKPINPAPSDAAYDVILDQETITWEDGGGATSYNVYYGTSEAGLALVSEGQTGLSFTITGIDSGSPFANSASRTWRIDAINENGTTTGNVWIFRTVHSNSFPWERPDDYDPDDEWDWDDTEGEYVWADVELTGGGRYKNRLVAVGHNTIYFGDI